MFDAMSCQCGSLGVCREGDGKGEAKVEERLRQTYKMEMRGINKIKNEKSCVFHMCLLCASIKHTQRHSLLTWKTYYDT